MRKRGPTLQRTRSKVWLERKPSEKAAHTKKT